jgi:hypothetical protein
VAIDPYPTPASPPPTVTANPPVPAIRSARRSRAPWVVAAVVVLVVALVGGAAYLGSRDSGTPTGSAGSPHSSATGHSSAPAADQAAAMQAFITTYLSTVTSDQHASWAMLTPSFQKASGGFGHYQQFWRAYSTATPQQISADPASMSVSYGVDYVKTDGSTSSDQVTLRLVKEGSSYLIDGET